MSEDLEKRLRSWGAPTKQRARPLMREAADALAALREKLAAVDGELLCLGEFVASYNRDEELQSLMSRNNELLARAEGARQTSSTRLGRQADLGSLQEARKAARRRYAEAPDASSCPVHSHRDIYREQIGPRVAGIIRAGGRTPFH